MNKSVAPSLRESPDAAAESAVSKQSGDAFRAVVAAYPHEPGLIATNLYWSRGALSRDLKRQVYTMLKDLQVIVDVARNPDGELGFRPKEEASEGARKDGSSPQTPKAKTGEA